MKYMGNIVDNLKLQSIENFIWANCGLIIKKENLERN